MRGQTAVETALTLPLVLFLFLGTLQLFLLLQGRMLASYAAYRSARAGALAYGSCGRMRSAALLAVLPAVDSYLGRSAGYSGSDSAAHALGEAYRKRRLNRFDDAWSSGGESASYSGRIVWLRRRFVDAAGAPVSFAGPELTDFDQPDNLVRLDLDLVFFQPMKVPFANWVLSAMFLGYAAVNPLVTPQTASWQPIGTMTSAQPHLVETRARAARGEYVFPIRVRSEMRMMTPLRAVNTAQDCF